MTDRTRIKICGVTKPADVDAAVEAGADAIGLVFYPPSPRAVSVAAARALAARLPPFVTPVGLFVNADDEQIDAVLDSIPGMLLQFHGDEDAAECERHLHPYLKAARMQPGFDLLDFAARFSTARGFVLDAHVEGYGGAGEVFDWSLIPPGVQRPVVLSGGLHAANVIRAIEQVRPWAVDVSSGVESSRGVKDAAAIRRFCDAVREADARLAAAEA
ncbi:phosphoribosylanthranilate isomerase [Schlegelella sp. ID0723]|uniref:N-(5'-phosphoribosyl)anthranilate isomerase n=1 Tax=Piscinibacter koreensis TaxID=2742824 RepID=A0A7Y6NLA1_9BURK|nr:phosphoribosylanthranilate isomerase [Schlegelella koreensis]